WDDIKVPSSDYNVRLVPNGGSIPAYWGRDKDGSCLFLIGLDGDHGKLFAENRTTVHGIGVELQADAATGKQNLVLTLERQIDGDLFSSLCESLGESLRPVERSDAALNVALTHIKRWKAFLAGRNARLLSPEEIQGLFAELTFLRWLYEKKLGRTAAVSAWTGADRVQQDFVFGGCAVEVKSISGTDRNTVRISSEDQLDSILDDLFLLTFRLRDANEAEQARSLNEIVELIESELMDADAIDEFARKLGAYGYAPVQEYDKPRFVVAATEAYRVDDGFPRIVRSNLPEGVTRVKYQIEIERLALYRCTLEEVLEKI
ncbi:MAG: PD-(D/E)XK motif protein, partial [Mesorhizobium sp.]